MQLIESRPAVLLVETETARRRAMAEGLSAYGYEVIPAVSADEGARFAEGLGASVIVAPGDLPGMGDESLIDRLTGSNGDRTLVLMGRGSLAEGELPDEVRLIPVEGVAADTLVRKIRLVLVGLEIGVEPDSRLDSLVGDLTLQPTLELVRALARAGFSGRVVVDDGEIAFDEGRVVAVAVGAARGLKAFCRLGRRLDGVFRIWPEPSSLERNILGGVDELVIRAVEDASAGEVPHPRTRLRLEMGPSFFRSSFGPLEQQILTAANQGETLGRLLDALPAPDGEILQALYELKDGGLLTLVEPQAQVRVVTDSSCDLPRELRARLGIETLPLWILLGKERLRDGVDLQPKDFYERLERKDVHPSTNPVTSADFHQVYDRVLLHRDVVSIHLSGKMSETLGNGREAGEELLRELPGRRDDGQPIELRLVDSELVSLPLGMLVMFAARMAMRGLSAADIAQRVEEMRRRFHVFFVVDTLEYLARGGRIGKAQAWFGKLLRIKPILSIGEGEVIPVDRVRGGRAAHPRIIELCHEKVEPSRPVVAGVVHAKAPVWAERLKNLVTETFKVSELLVTEVGPVVGTHGGPGMVGVTLFQPTDEEAALVAPIGSAD